MLLAADVGNTTVTLGLFAGKRLAARGSLRSDPRRPDAAYAADLRRFLRGRAVEGAVFGSVVPGLDRVWRSAVRRACGADALAITPRSRLGVRLRVDRPGEVGADRLLNALAAFDRFRGPAVVADFGTATTFDCVSARGDYLGGAILIGPGTAARALAERTAKLPLVEPARSRRAIGKNTVECIRVGLYEGYLGMVERVLERTLAEMRRSEGRRIGVVATGGWGGLFGPPLGAPVDRDLTLKGLRLAYQAVTMS